MQFNPGDVIHAQVTKGDVLQEAGLELEVHHGRYYVKKVKGLFRRRNVPVQVGDQLLKLNGRDVEDYRDVKEMKQLIKSEMSIQIVYMRTDPEDSSEGTYDEEEQPEVYETIEYPQQDYPKLRYSNIRPGDTMMLDDLVSKPELNGQIVKVLEEASTPGRWQVEIQNSRSQVLSAKEENLFPVSYEEGPEDDDEQEELLQLGYSVQPGMKMRLFALKKKAKMNGTHVKVLNEARPGRWEVEIIDTRQKMSVSEENLKPI